MLYGEITAVCSQIHTKHTNTLCGHNVESVNVKLAVHIVTTGLSAVISCWQATTRHSEARITRAQWPAGCSESCKHSTLLYCQRMSPCAIITYHFAPFHTTCRLLQLAESVLAPPQIYTQPNAGTVLALKKISAHVNLTGNVFWDTQAR